MIKVRKIIQLKVSTFSVFFFLLFAASGWMNFGCNQSGESENNAESTFQKLELNDGVKWEANIETVDGINAMIAQIEEWQENSDLRDAARLKNDLEAEYQLIFKRCTMTGDAHDQLHNYLMPLKEYIQCLDETEAEKFNSCMINLQDHLQLFSEFFE